MQEKCSGPEWAPWSSTGLYHCRKSPSVWTHCLGEIMFLYVPSKKKHAGRIPHLQKHHFSYPYIATGFFFWAHSAEVRTPFTRKWKKWIPAGSSTAVTARDHAACRRRHGEVLIHLGHLEWMCLCMYIYIYNYKHKPYKVKIHDVIPLT